VGEKGLCEEQKIVPHIRIPILEFDLKLCDAPEAKYLWMDLLSIHMGVCFSSPLVLTSTSAKLRSLNEEDKDVWKVYIKYKVKVKTTLFLVLLLNKQSKG